MSPHMLNRLHSLWLTLLIAGCMQVGIVDAKSPVADNKSPLPDLRQDTAEHVVRIAADPWCPYNCDPGAKHEGFMIDIARAALAFADLQVEYVIINWARAKQMVRAGLLDGIVGMSRTPRSEKLYHFSDTPLGWSEICFYRRADDPWEYHSVRSLEHRVMGWINGYGFAANPEIEAWVIAHLQSPQLEKVSGTKVHQSLFAMLLAKRIDTFAEDRYVVAHALKQHSLQGQIEVAGCASNKDEVHLAFSHASPHKEEWAQALEGGVAQLRANGELKRILARYQIELTQWLNHQ